MVRNIGKQFVILSLKLIYLIFLIQLLNKVETTTIFLLHTFGLILVFVETFTWLPHE